MLASQQFETNAYYEAWGQKCREDPKHLNTMSPTNRLAFLEYEARKREAEHLEQVRKEGATK